MTNKDDVQTGDVYVNEDCIGCSACVTICGNVFNLNEEGLAFAKKNMKKNKDIDNAISSCPVNAIYYKN